jgi:hypothetical protein
MQQFVGIDWAYPRAAWCAKNAGGDVRDEGRVPAHEYGLGKLVRTSSFKQMNVRLTRFDCAGYGGCGSRDSTRGARARRG